MRTHLQGRGAAVDDNRFARSAKRGGSPPDRFFFGAAQGDIFVKGHADKMRRVRDARSAGDEPGAAMNPDEPSEALEPAKIAPDRGLGRIHQAVELVKRNELSLLEELQDRAFAFGGVHYDPNLFARPIL